MAEYKIVTCESWQHFKSGSITELCDKGPFKRGVYLFRGHGSAKWSLMSSFDRAHIGKSRKLKVKMADELIMMFQREAEGVEVDKSIWDDKVARLALAQHFGVPTRLLDWTESPYIAAFFAYAGIALNPNPEAQVAVWCLNTRSEIWSPESGVEVLDIPSFGNDRLRSQLGKFTLLKAPFDSLEEYVQKFEEDDGALTQFLLPSSDALVALADLDVMGINYPRLFSGLDGCAKAASLRMLFKSSLTEEQGGVSPIR
ncbi:MAG TPA: FRG domain-containing protein [Pyrinomonadaceae bacterium]